jgi:hypothetical protein
LALAVADLAQRIIDPALMGRVSCD